MNKLDFGPLITAVVTPFDTHHHVDIFQLEKLLIHLLDQGSTSILVTSLMGEGQTLNSVEKLRMWESTVDFVGDQLPVIADVGTNNTKTTLHNVRLAEEADVDALLVVVPYYNKPTQQGLLTHFREVAASTELPILLYNDPRRCGIGLELETILDLAQLKNVVGVVDVSHGLDLIRKVKDAAPEDFLVYSGDDRWYLGNLKLGGVGGLSTASHFVGKSMRTIFDLYRRGHVDEAEILNSRLIPLYQITSNEVGPASVKALLNQGDFDVGGVRLPLVDLEAVQVNTLWEVVSNLLD